MKYKNISTVAHNLGHSFLSITNAVGSGRRYAIVPELLFRTAEDTGVVRVRIDLLTGEVEPDAVAVPQVREAVGYYVQKLPRMLSSQNVSPTAITAATLTIDFDYSRRRQAKHHPEATIPEFACVVELTDDRGEVHRGEPDNWWHA